MTLAFSTTWPDGRPTYFRSLIWEGLKQHPQYQETPERWKIDLNYHLNACGLRFSRCWKKAPEGRHPKLHTIRHPRRGKAQWDEGRPIHFTSGNRTKHHFQFAPLLPCTGVEDLFLTWNPRTQALEATVEEEYLIRPELEDLAINDGFEDLESFARWFFPKDDEWGEASLQLIHWTRLRYGR